MLKWLFSQKKKNIDLDELKSEHWESNFSMFQDKRFPHETHESYRCTGADKGSGLKLTLEKSHFFAWVVNPYFQYEDFVWEADLEFSPENGHSSTGFILRYINDENYYYVMISNHGQIRFDAVFNGHPQVIIPWTPVPEALNGMFELMIIAHGRQFTFFINKEWTAEGIASYFPSGRLAWAGQNYGDTEKAGFYLRRALMESRPIEVENLYERWVRTVPALPAQRRLLARRFLEQGLYTEAELQMRLSLGEGETGPDELFFLAQCRLRQGFYKDAEDQLNSLLEKYPEWEPAMKEKAGILYLQNRFLELRNYLVPLLQRFDKDEVLWSLLGHGQDNLGNFEQAAEAYARAAQLNPKMPIFRMNQARSLEKIKKDNEAVEAYLAAAKEFFRQESWEDLDFVLARVQAKDPGHPDIKALQGKACFQTGDILQAKTHLESAYGAGSKDSTVPYLLGLQEKQAGHLKKALAYFEEAAAMESEFSLYHFRVAETLHALHKDPTLALQKARELAPQDPWILNLQGQLCSDPREKGFLLEKAHLALPQDPVLAVNLAQHLYDTGKKAEAFKLMEKFGDAPEALNHRGNLLAQDGKWKDALKMYEKAMTKDSGNLDFKANAAAACVQLEYFSRAETLFLQILDQQPIPSVYASLGNLFRITGDIVRAEVALRTGLEQDPEHITCLRELAILYLDRAKYSQAEDVLIRLIELDRSPDSMDLYYSWRRMTQERLSCSSCGREWWVPLNIGSQGPLKIHGEPPAEAPAGMSPVTGKIFCIGCAQHHLKDQRFVCPDSGEFLRLTDDRLKYLLVKAIEKQ